LQTDSCLDGSRQFRFHLPLFDASSQRGTEFTVQLPQQGFPHRCAMTDRVRGTCEGMAGFESGLTLSRGQNRQKLDQQALQFSTPRIRILIPLFLPQTSLAGRTRFWTAVRCWRVIRILWLVCPLFTPLAVPK